MKNILSQGSFWIVNKEFTLRYGLDPSFLLADLITRQEYWEARGATTPDGFFFCEKERIMEATTMSLYRQTAALTVLTENRFVETIKKGVPQKIFYRINTALINETIMRLMGCEAVRDQTKSNEVHMQVSHIRDFPFI